ncbi:hypothetical protein ZWY2020_005522 [Hordeum vulgare]|nr:hypothetical protein ZWY2020_005522 [Hordeum vulgare]
MSEYENLRPSVPDAQSIVGNLKVLFRHLQEQLMLTEEKVKESQYQITPWQNELPTKTSLLAQSPNNPLEKVPNKSSLDIVPQTPYPQDRHYVNLSRGSIPAAPAGQGADEVSYQRLCIPLDDGGVITLDWPANLYLDKEHGLDSTVLIVPGTPEGSMDRGVEMSVLDTLKNGYFPIVMNPRGCGGSPLTTPSCLRAYSLVWIA